MSACLVCPPLACRMDCEASKELLLPLSCEAETSYQSSNIDNSASTTTATLAALHPTVARIDQLPNELKGQIFGYLEPDLESIRNIRLVSRSWAFLGSPHLLDPTFNMLSNRDDMNRLVGIAQHPYFSQRIRKLAIKWTSIHEGSLRLELLAPYAHASYDEDFFRENWGKWLKFKGLVDLYSDTFCDKDLLAVCFNSLTNLDSLTIYPDYDPLELRNPPRRIFAAFDHEETRKIFHNIFSTMSISTTKISSLSWFPAGLRHDEAENLPNLHALEGFPRIRDSIALIIPELEAFTFKIKYGRNSFCNIYNQECRDFFAKAVKLQTLRIWDEKWKPYWSNNANFAIDCAVLQSLHLNIWEWTLSQIQQLLFKHCATLRDVSIRMTFLQKDWQEEMQSLLKMMKEEMQLEKLEFICCGFSQFGHDGNPDRIKMEEWITEPQKLTEREADVWDLKCDIENYVIHDGPYPPFPAAEECYDFKSS